MKLKFCKFTKFEIKINNNNEIKIYVNYKNIIMNINNYIIYK